MKVDRKKLARLAEAYFELTDYRKLPIDDRLAHIVEDQLDVLDFVGFKLEVEEVDAHIDSDHSYYIIRIFDSVGKKLSFFRDENEDVATICALLKLHHEFSPEQIPWDRSWE